MQKLLISLGCLASLAGVGCSKLAVHKIDIPQGNVVTQEMVDRLKPGMTKRQVRFVMGTPLVVGPFHPDRWDYVYSFQPGGGERKQRRVSLFFDQDRLVRLEGDFQPRPKRDAEPPALSRETVVTVPPREAPRKGIFRRLLEKIGIGGAGR